MKFVRLEWRAPPDRAGPRLVDPWWIPGRSLVDPWSILVDPRRCWADPAIGLTIRWARPQGCTRSSCGRHVLRRLALRCEGGRERTRASGHALWRKIEGNQIEGKEGADGAWLLF